MDFAAILTDCLTNDGLSDWQMTDSADSPHSGAFMVMESAELWQDPDFSITGPAAFAAEAVTSSDSSDNAEDEEPVYLTIGEKRRKLSDLKYGLFGENIGLDEALVPVIRELDRFVAGSDWEFSDEDEVVQFHAALITAATRTDLPEDADLRLVLPEAITSAFRHLYDQCRDQNPAVYNQIISDPGIVTIFRYFWSEASQPHGLTDLIYDADVSFINLLRVYAEQPVRTIPLLTSDFVRKVCRSIVTVLVQKKSTDMREFRPDFVTVIRPALKLLLRDFVRNKIHWNRLTAFDKKNVEKWMPIWFWEEGKLAEETALSLELDVIDEQLKQAIAIHSEFWDEKDERRNRLKLQRDQRRSARLARMSPYVRVNGAATTSKSTSHTSVPAIAASLREQRRNERLDRLTRNEAAAVTRNSPNQVSVPVASASPATVTQKKKSDRWYWCSKCPYRSIDKKRVDDHFQCHGSGRDWKCKWCDWSGPNTAALLSHARVHLCSYRPNEIITIDLSDEEDDDPVEVIAEFVEPDELVDGMVCMPYYCEKCPAHFTSADGLQCHRRRHGNRAKYMCDCCDYSSANPAATEEHKKLHVIE
jgi:hypothetical protein